MDVHRASFCFFLLSLQVRSSSGAEVAHFYKNPGEKVTITCIFSSPGTWRMFCRENCEGENILIRTSEKENKCKRYKTEYKSSKFEFHLKVSISDLTLSDSGLYTCGLVGSSSVSYDQFRLVVVDALLDGTKDRRLFKETGSSLTVACSFSGSGRTKLFCRGECDEDRILVQTDGVRGQMGRYRIESEKRSSKTVLYVSIKRLTWSDSGLYRCQQGRVSRRSHGDFNLVVLEEVQPTTTLSFSSGAGSSQPPVSTGQSVLLQGTTTSGDVLLFVVLTLSFIIILFSTALLVFCKHRSAQRDPPVQTAAAEPDGIYEDIREDEELRRPLPVDNSTVYSCISLSKQTAAGANDSVIAAASFQQKAADLLSDLPMVTFSNQSLDLPIRSSDGSAAVYSLVQNASRDADEPLYSNSS